MYLRPEDKELGLEPVPRWLAQTIKDLKRHEGFRPYAYPDPRSRLGQTYKGRKYGWGYKPAGEILSKLGEPFSAGVPWTVGYGNTIGTTPHTFNTEPKAAEDLKKLALSHVEGLDSIYKNWESEPLFVSTVLANMAYNLGLVKLSKFAPTLALIRARRYEEAATRLTKTAWYKQVGSRGVELVDRLRKQRIAPEHL